MYLIIVDVYCIWPEIVKMKTTIAEERVTQLRTVIARMGILHQIVSDNGPHFTSKVFRRFTRANGIKHVTGAPYHPSMKGIAERLVRSFKRPVKADHTEITAQHSTN
ncbi:igE-binding protein-like [Corticium candelabrum]|uniref:igE-binding protein-like n=1 Tax=Corticium candelabrum TaxID=121492 RepID=UPI002E2770AE|nr:igE-binding protein-like [Corticium candelabrum]